MLAHPDEHPMFAALPVRSYSVVVWGVGSMNTTVDARAPEEAERLAIEGFRDGSLAFDETVFGNLDAEADER